MHLYTIFGRGHHKQSRPDLVSSKSKTNPVTKVGDFIKGIVEDIKSTLKKSVPEEQKLLGSGKPATPIVPDQPGIPAEITFNPKDLLAIIVAINSPVSGSAISSKTAFPSLRFIISILASRISLVLMSKTRPLT